MKRISQSSKTFNALRFVKSYLSIFPKNSDILQVTEIKSERILL